MFDFLGALGATLPGYQQGQQQAINDNWNDLLKYNQTLAGQLQNMFDEQVMPFRYNIFQDQAALSDLNKRQAGMTVAQNTMAHPGLMERNRIMAAAMPNLTQRRIDTTLDLLGRLGKMDYGQPNAGAFAPLDILQLGF